MFVYWNKIDSALYVVQQITLLKNLIDKCFCQCYHLIIIITFGYDQRDHINSLNIQNLIINFND
jgi:hypothetical protein